MSAFLAGVTKTAKESFKSPGTRKSGVSGLAALDDIIFKVTKQRPSTTGKANKSSSPPTGTKRTRLDKEPHNEEQVVSAISTGGGKRSKRNITDKSAVNAQTSSREKHVAEHPQNVRTAKTDKLNKNTKGKKNSLETSETQTTLEKKDGTNKTDERSIHTDQTVTNLPQKMGDTDAEIKRVRRRPLKTRSPCISQKLTEVSPSEDAPKGRGRKRKETFDLNEPSPKKSTLSSGQDDDQSSARQLCQSEKPEMIEDSDILKGGKNTPSKAKLQAKNPRKVQYESGSYIVAEVVAPNANENKEKRTPKSPENVQGDLSTSCTDRISTSEHFKVHSDNTRTSQSTSNSQAAFKVSTHSTCFRNLRLMIYCKLILFYIFSLS